MKRISLGNHLTPGLLVLCLLLTGILVYESRNMIQPPGSTPTVDQQAPSRVNRDSFTAPAISVFSETTERPLFMNGREPPPEPEAAPAVVAVKTPLRLQLEGVAITPEASIAVVRDLSTNKILRLGEGMKHKGWEVTSVTATGVTLQYGKQSQELNLKPDGNNHQR